MIVHELKKILKQKVFILLFLLLTGVNCFFYWNMQKETNISAITGRKYFESYLRQYGNMSIESATAELTDVIENMKNFSKVELYKLIPNGEIYLADLEKQYPGIIAEYEESCYANDLQNFYAKYWAADKLNKQLLYISEWPLFVMDMKVVQEKMEKTSIFGTKDTFVWKNTQKTVADFEGLEMLILKPGMSEGVVSFIKNPTADLFLIFLSIYASALIFYQEKKNNLIPILRCCKKGTVQLAGCKVIVLSGVIVFASFVIYGTLFIEAALLYGFGDLSRPLQSLEEFKNCNLRISVLGFFILFYCTSIFLFIIIGCIAGAVFMLAGRGTGYVLAGLFLIIEWICFYKIQPTSPIAVFHFINIFFFFDQYQCIGQYWNFNLFSNAVSAIDSFVLFLAIGILTAPVVCIVAFCSKTHRRRKQNSYKLMNRVGRWKAYVPICWGRFGLEANKILYKNHGIYLVLLAAIFLIHITQTEHVILRNEKERLYQFYAETYAGRLDSEVMEKFEEEYEYLTNLPLELENLEIQYREGYISADLYEADRFMVLSEMERMEVFEEVYNQALQVVELEKTKGIPAYFTSRLAGDFLFDRTQQNYNEGFWITVLLVLFTVCIFPPEYESNMISLLRSSRHGQLRIIVVKGFVGYMVALLLSVGLSVSRIISLHCLFDFSLWNAPIQSLPQMVEFPVRTTIGCFLMGIVVLQLGGLLMIMTLLLSISILLERVLHTVVVELAIFAFPLLLASLGVSFKWENTGNRVFDFGGTLQKGEVEDQIIYVLILAFLTIVIGWFGLRHYRRCTYRTKGRKNGV